MSDIRFPTIDVACMIPGAPLGGSQEPDSFSIVSDGASVRTSYASYADREVKHTNIDGRGVNTPPFRRSSTSGPLSAGQLSQVARAVTACANALPEPAQTTVRDIAAKLRAIAATR